MDSAGNYSNVQSSSGGGVDQEFNSQASDSVSSFMNSYASHFLPSSNPQSSFPSAHLTTTPFDNPSSNCVQPSFSHSHSQPQYQPSLNPISQGRGLRSDQVPLSGAYMSQPSMQTQAAGTVHVVDNARASGSSEQTTRVARNTKKRTRASRRAPTTVLTTDTTNFRAMVQEFTGIPEPTFPNSPRLDLFGFASGSAPTLRSANQLEPTGTLYPARSLPQNAQPVVNNSLVDPMGNFPNSANTASIPAATNTFDMYQHVSGLGVPGQAQDMLSMQSQDQTLNSSQPLLQSSAPAGSFNVTSFGTMSQLGSLAAAFVSQELGVGHGHVNAGFSGLLSTHADGLYNGIHEHQVSSFNENYSAHEAQCNNSYNLNYTAASSNIHHRKNLDNVTSRGEVTAESWIYP